ncbi:MAG: FAD-dependent oxidoreductase [Firmicutes bacterium]|nr:FAD-dependent oxidoreductase [Bacillota bacterium]MBE3590892.1 FAD-dependent oxidoreductase [Bacillota bacterium]
MPDDDAIVILGAGYAGLTAYLELRRALGRSAPLCLVNRGRTHYFTTELHEFAAGEEEEADITVPLERVVQPPHRLVVDRVLRIDAAARRVVCERGEVPYARLIVALGSIPEYYGVPGAKEHGVPLTDLRSARRLRARLEELAERRPDARVVVAGGGLTGVQLAAEVADSYPDLRVTVIDAGPHIMPGFEPELVEAAVRVLEGKGVQILTGRAITEVDAHEVTLEGGAARAYDLLVWAGGVRANPVVRESGLPVTRGDRGLVDAYLRCPDDERIFLAGDCAAPTDPASGRVVPPTAQMAVQEGRLAARNAWRAERGQELEAFVPRQRGVFASLGRREGVGRWGRESLYGMPAMVVKRLVEAHHAYDVGGLAYLLRRLAAIAGWGNPARRRAWRRRVLPAPEGGRPAGGLLRS